LLIAGLLLPLGIAAAGDLRLVGTVMLGDDGAGPSHAVFETDDYQQLIIEQGQEIAGCFLAEIETRQVRMECAGGEVSLVLRSKLRAVRQPQTVTPTRYDVSLPREDFLSSVADRQRLVSQVALEPAVRDGYLQGYRVAWLLPGGDFHRLGLQDGDVILSLNGVSASDPGTFMETISALRGQPGFELIVERSGEPLAYHYTLR
jgi:type II secretion system protein C